LPFRAEGKHTDNTQVWDIALLEPELQKVLGQATAMVHDLDFVLFKVAPCDVEMVRTLLIKNSFTVIRWIWYKVDANMTASLKPVPATECLVYGYMPSRMEQLFAGSPANPVERHNVIMGTYMRTYLKDESGDKYNPCQSPRYLWYHLLAQLGGGVETIIDVCAGTGSATLAAVD
jgi:hypothetical protein